MIIISLKALAEDFVRVVHASIVDKRYYQDFFYLGHVYRLRIKHLRYDPKTVNRMPFSNRKQSPTRIMHEVGECVTCGGPAVGPVCMFKGCDIVTAQQKQ